MRNSAAPDVVLSERAGYVLAFARELLQVGYRPFPHSGLIAAKFGWRRREA
jgi:hypothetical protein